MTAKSCKAVTLFERETSNYISKKNPNSFIIYNIWQKLFIFQISSIIHDNLKDQSLKFWSIHIKK